LIFSALGDARWLQPFWLALRVAAFAYAGYLLLLFLLQRSMVFPGSGFPSPRASAAEHPPGVDQIWLDTSFGRTEAWLLEASGTVPGPALIFAHGNGELIDDWLLPMERIRRGGVSVLLVEYPGYGHSDGRPSRATLAETFEHAFDALTGRPGIDAARVVAAGRSLGGGAVADLVETRPVAAMVLMSTFTSAADVAWRSFRAPPFVVRDRFDVVGAVRRFDGPVLLMHGRGDEVLSFDYARRLAEARDGLAVTFLDCGHNDCLTVWPETVETLLDFLDAHGLRGPPPGGTPS
jgi:uncharacterized protein